MPVEYVLEFHSQLERRCAFLADPENAAEVHVLRRLPLPTVVVVVSGRGAEGSCRRVGPSGRIQHERLCGIEMRVGVHQEQVALAVGGFQKVLPPDESVALLPNWAKMLFRELGT